MRIIPSPGQIVNGEILLSGDDILKKTDEEMRRIRWKKISIIFQGAILVFLYKNHMKTIY